MSGNVPVNMQRMDCMNNGIFCTHKLCPIMQMKENDTLFIAPNHDWIRSLEVLISCIRSSVMIEIGS